MQGVRVWSLVRELRSHMLRGVARKKQTNKQTTRGRYLISKAQSKMKMQSPYSAIIKNFKMVTKGH